MFVRAAHHGADRGATQDRLGHRSLTRDNCLGGFQYGVDLGSRDEDHGAGIGDDIVARMNRDAFDCQRNLYTEFNDAAARCLGSQPVGEHWEAIVPRLVDVADGAVGDHSCNAARLCASGQKSAPAAGFDT